MADFRNRRSKVGETLSKDAAKVTPPSMPEVQGISSHTPSANPPRKINYCGVLCVDKPSGMTSHDVVSRVRRLFGQKRAGHTGTLDPLATGVMIICLGPATRIAEYLAAERKAYTAGVVFGVSTDTEDISGRIMQETDASHLTKDAVLEVLSRFFGRIKQIPPMVSAVHHEGRRLYELAREGKEVDREARDVEIYRLEMTSFSAGRHPEASLEIECSTGTYVRTLLADIGRALEVGGMMASLLRTSVGSITLEDCHSLEELEEHKHAGTLVDLVAPITKALMGWPMSVLSELEYVEILHGRTIEVSPELDVNEGGLVLLTDNAGEATAIAALRGTRLAPTKVLVQPALPEV